VAANRRKARIGRPPKPAAEKQAYPVQVNLTRDELRRLLEAAEGEAPASYVRRLVLGHLDRSDRQRAR
jgi:hypothetical protein